MIQMLISSLKYLQVTFRWMFDHISQYHGLNKLTLQISHHFILQSCYAAIIISVLLSF